jgi:hypothetical protein
LRWAVRVAAGAPAAVTVTNGIGGTILTQGVAAFGIFAQSVGGGGGEGSLAGTVNGSLQSLGVGIGGNGGGGGDGGVVTVTTGDGGSTITTTGKHGIAIFAQSVGGGGGLVRTMTTDQTFDPSKIVINPQGRLADVHGFSLNIGGQNGMLARVASTFLPAARSQPLASMHTPSWRNRSCGVAAWRLADGRFAAGGGFGGEETADRQDRTAARAKISTSGLALMGSWLRASAAVAVPLGISQRP